MTDHQPSRRSLGQAPDADLAGYQAISGMAVAALLVGLLSATALVDPWCWLFPALGVLLGAVALWRIARTAPALLGRKAALVGVGLSLVFGVAAAGYRATQQVCLRREARAFALDWFALLAAGQPQIAHQLTLHPNQRLPLSPGLWSVYQRDPQQRKQLRDWAADPLLKTLLLLGEKATIRYWSTEQVTQQEGSQVVEQVFSVTFDEPGKGKQTFYLLLTLRRDRPAQPDRIPWSVITAQPGIRPRWLPQDDPPA